MRIYFEVEYSTSKPVITCLDPLLKGKSDFSHLEEATEEEADYSHMNKKRKIILGSDWAEKLEEKREDT